MTNELTRAGESVSRFRRPTIWLLAFGLVAVVLIEGFALSWGDARTVPTKVSPPHTRTTVASPGIRLCPKTTAQLIEVDYLRNPGYGEKASVTGHQVTVSCGGFDDFHFVVHSKPVTVHLRKDARIVLMTSAPSYYLGNLNQLNVYLSIDFDGNVFAVTGPDSNATGLVAQFHP